MLSALLLSLTVGGWGGGNCGPVGPPVASFSRPAPVVAPAVPVPLPPGKNDCGCSALCVCGCQAGGACPCVGKPSKTKVPAAPAERELLPEPQAVSQNFGLELDKMGRHADRPVYRLNGREVSRDEAVERIVAGGQLTDDSAKPRLTVIGADAERKRVLDDLASAPALAPFKDKFLVQAYPPDHWAVKGAGFKLDGHPAVYCQQADGKVLHRQDDYDGPEGLAEALRKADPTYDPSKDKDRRKPDLLPGLPFELSTEVLCGLGLAAALVVLYLLPVKPAAE